MDTRLLSLLPVEQARCREIAHDFTAMGSIGCFAAALIEQALRRADRAIIDGGGEDAIRGVLRDLQAFDTLPQGSNRPAPVDRFFSGHAFIGAPMLPVAYPTGRSAHASIN